MSEMKISVENVGRLSRRLSVIVPISQLEETKKHRLAEMAKKMRLDGFRPGKVPVRVIEKLYGGSVWGEVIQESLQASLSVAFEKNALNPAGQPHIDLIKAEFGNDLEYTAIFEVYPQVLAPELKGINLEKLKVDITEKDIDVVLEKMRHQHADWVEVARKAQYGDKVVFDLLLSEGESRKALEWVLEEGKIPEEFSALLASTAGESLPVSLPGNEGSGPISATIEVQKVTEPQLAALEDAFANRLGIQEGGIDALRIQIRQPMQNELDRILREKLKTQVIEQLLALHSIDDLPQVLLDQEFQRLEIDVQRQGKQQGKNTERSLSDEVKKGLLQEAERRVKLGLLFNAVIEKHQLQVDEVRVQQEVERLVSAFQFEQTTRDRFYKDENMMRAIRSATLEEQVIDKLLEEVEYTEKTAEYVEIMDLSIKN